MSMGEGGLPGNPEDTAIYIASMARELRLLALRDRLDFIAYLLAMVEDEAARFGGPTPAT